MAPGTITNGKGVLIAVVVWLYLHSCLFCLRILLGCGCLLGGGDDRRNVANGPISRALATYSLGQTYEDNRGTRMASNQQCKNELLRHLEGGHMLHVNTKVVINRVAGQ